MPIQIQHLLKLNYVVSFKPLGYSQIQIQHLLKLNNEYNPNHVAPPENSNTTLVKVKYNVY